MSKQFKPKSWEMELDEITEAHCNENSEETILSKAQEINDHLTDTEDNDPYVCGNCSTRLNDEWKECDICGTRKRKYKHLIFNDAAPTKFPKRLRMSIPVSSNTSLLSNNIEVDRCRTR